MSAEWHDRLKHWMRTLQDDFYEPLGEISWEAARTTERLSPEGAEALSYEAVQPGWQWGTEWEYCWFRTRIALPERARGERIVMDLHPGGESTLFVDGQAFGTYRADWVSRPHHFLEDNFLTACAEGGETYTIQMETYAGHDYPEAPTGGCATGPVLPGAYEEHPEEGKRRILGRCSYGIWNEACYQLFMDADTLCQLLDTLEPSSLRAAKVAEALERFTLAVDFEQDRESRISSYLAGRAVLAPVLAAENGPTVPKFYAVGNAHLDLAWLWPMEETFRKTARTFAAQLRLLEEYPEYRFIQSQPAAYEMCREYAPELFRRIQEAVKKGGWIADGAMWVEPDTNMAGGEALIRQLLYGKAYYKKEFGVDSRLLWLPDTFGYTAALPQLLAGCGVDYLVTQKIFWSYNDGEQFPYHYFRWEGLDGSSVTAFLPTNYTYRTDPSELQEIWRTRSQTRDLDAFLLPFGYGDGGGGPSRDYLEYGRREKNLEGMPMVKMAGPMEFFHDMEKAGGPVNTYVGELYFTAHRGTYTSQAKIKYNNRRAEAALRELELWMCAADKEERDAAERLWKELLLHQFHDILPGSGIARIHKEADERVRALIAEASRRTGACMDALLCRDRDAVTVFNSLSFDRTGLVELPGRFAQGAAVLNESGAAGDGAAQNVPVQNIGGRIMALVSVPSVGSVSLVPMDWEAEREEAGREELDRAAEPGENGGMASVRLSDGVFVLENRFVRAAVDRRGELKSFVWKESGREFAQAPMNRFCLYKDVPRRFDAWDIDSNYREQELPGAEIISAEPVSEGLAAELLVRGRIGNSSYEQRIVLAAQSRRLEFHTTIEWNELHRLLKVSFPVAVHASEGINEIQFGYIRRPSHRSRSYDRERFEVCNHRYSALAEDSHGAAVLNDGKYGISMNRNALELTLLRAGASPELRADNGEHRFVYAFTAWEGSFAGSDAVRQGYELNVPLLVREGWRESGSWLRIDDPAVILETVKSAEDGSGDRILRFYESMNRSVSVQIHSAWSGDMYLCNMLEEKTEALPSEQGTFSLDFRPFEVKTVRVHAAVRK